MHTKYQQVPYIYFCRVLKMFHFFNVESRFLTFYVLEGLFQVFRGNISGFQFVLFFRFSWGIISVFLGGIFSGGFILGFYVLPAGGCRLAQPVYAVSSPG